MTKPTFFVEEDKILGNLFEEGLENLHLYKPGASPMYSERLLTLLGDDYRNRITVHGHFYLKEDLTYLSRYQRTERCQEAIELRIPAFHFRQSDQQGREIIVHA